MIWNLLSFSDDKITKKLVRAPFAYYHELLSSSCLVGKVPSILAEIEPIILQYNSK